MIFISHILKVGRVIGMDSSCFKENPPNWYAEPVSKMNYGFGVFMAICKESYVPIPDVFKVWFGDTIQFKENTPVAVSGCRIITPMRGTSRKLNLRKERILEPKAFKEYCKNE